MKTKIVVPANPHKLIAAQSAQTGLISVGDLSLLTGVPSAKLNILAKKGILRSYDEYHGKRFFKFDEIMTWLCDSNFEDATKQELRAALEVELKAFDCPYALKKVESASDGMPNFEVVWKDLIAA